MSSKKAIETFFEVSSEDDVATEAGAQNFLASKLQIDQSKPEGQKLYFETKYGRIGIGSFITPTIAEMEEMLHEESNKIDWSIYQNTTNGASLGNALDMHHTCEDAIVMGAASQPNCLEMGSPLVKPSDGIDGYISDPTQGPACALSTTMNLLFRQYLLPVEATTGLMSNKYVNQNGLLNEEKLFSEFQEWIRNKNDDAIQKFGQHDDRQLNCLKPFQKKLIELGLIPHDGSEEFFIYNNGYSFPKDISGFGEKPIISELNRINDFLLKDPTTNKERTDIQKYELRESLINSFAVGITTDAKFACGYDDDTLQFHRIDRRIDDKKVIDQVWVSAFPIGYDSKNHGIKAWEPLARLALVAAAKAQLIQGARLNARLINRGEITEGKDLKPTYLTKVGGGVFKNPEEWIANSIVEAASSLKKKFPQVSFAAELSHWDGYGSGVINEEHGYPKARNELIAAKSITGNLSPEEARWEHWRQNTEETSTAAPFSDSTSANTSPAHLIDRNKWITDRLNLSNERERAINPAQVLFSNSRTQDLTRDDRDEIDNFLKLTINSSGLNDEKFFVSAIVDNSTFNLGYHYKEKPVPDNLVDQAISDYRDRLNTDFEESLRIRALDPMFARKDGDANTAKYKLNNSPIEIDCDYYYDRQNDFAQPLTELSKIKPFVGCGEIDSNTPDNIVRDFVSSIVEGWHDRSESKPISAKNLYTQEKKAYLILNESDHWLSIEIAFKKDAEDNNVVEVNYSNPSGGQQSGCSKNVETFIKKVVGFLELVVNTGVVSHVQNLSEWCFYKEAVPQFVNDDQKIVLEAQNVTIQEKHLLEQGTRAGCGPAAKANLALLMGDKVRIGKVEISRKDFARNASIGERGLILLPEDELRLRLQDRYEIFQTDARLTDDRCGVSGVNFGSFRDLQVIKDYIDPILEEQVSRADSEEESVSSSMDGDEEDVSLDQNFDEDFFNEIYKSVEKNPETEDPDNWARLKSLLLHNDDKAKSFLKNHKKNESKPFNSAEILTKFENEDREVAKKSLTEEFNKIKVIKSDDSSHKTVTMEDWLKEEKNKKFMIKNDGISKAKDAANKAIKEGKEEVKVFSGTLDKNRSYERFVGKDFQNCDMKNLFRATFLKCTFDKNCKLPTDLSSLEPKYFSQCKIHASLLDSDVGQSFKKKFGEKFKLTKEGDFYYTPKNERKYVPKNSPTNPTAFSLTEQSRGLGGL